jgi:hypothetical protein
MATAANLKAQGEVAKEVTVYWPGIDIRNEIDDKAVF